MASDAPAVERASDHRLFVYPQPGNTTEQGVTTVTSATRLATRAFEELAETWWDAAASDANVGPVTRAAELLLVHAPTAIFASVLSHELLGHGARARELGFSPSYRITPPPPYYVPPEGPWGYTDYGERALPTTLDEELVLDLGGLEADELQVREVAFTGFRSGALRQGDLMLYVTGRLHLLSMIPRHDSDLYRFYAHAAARHHTTRRAPRSELETAAIASLVDPLFIYSLYAAAYRFIVEGERTHPYPAVDLAGRARLSGGYRPIPVPWGVAHQLEVMAGSELGNAVARVRIGNGLERGSLSSSLSIQDVKLSDHVRVGATVEMWSQPPLVTARELAAQAPGATGVGMLGGLPAGAGIVTGGVAASDTVTGGAAELVAEHRLDPWSWGVAVGGKTPGLRPGLPLGRDVYSSVFVGWRL